MSSPSDPPQPSEGWSVGEVAERTGLKVSTLRMWESRYGLPRPTRLPNGHRRYSDDDLGLVTEASRLHASGMRLEAAIVQADAARRSGPGPRSVFAAVRRAHPGTPVRVMRKRTLTAVSWALEDELRGTAEHAHLHGAFEEVANYEAAAERWQELAALTASTHVFADFARSDPAGRRGRPRRVRLPAGHPMRREWAVVCDGTRLPVALSAWEVPGQADVRDPDRLFEMVWTVDPRAVRAAARVCCEMAGIDEPALPGLDAAPAGAVDAGAVASLVTRMLGYVDGVAPRPT